MENKGKTWSRGTNSYLPFGVNVNFNLTLLLEKSLHFEIYNPQKSSKGLVLEPWSGGSSSIPHGDRPKINKSNK